MAGLFKVGDIVVDEDYVMIDVEREGVIESVDDGFCFIRWKEGDDEYYSTTNFEWLKRKEDRIKELKGLASKYTLP